ncbi:MAG: DUF1549 domain-containing protein, partial [Planctomycetales bacterium]
MMTRCGFIIVLLSLPSGLFAADDYFTKQVAPILRKHCLVCHNADKAEGGLSLTTAEEAMAGGDSGEVIIAGDLEGSYLLEQITPVDSVAAMPEGQSPLSEEDIATIQQWISTGAEWPVDVKLEKSKWWSLRPLVKPLLPTSAGGQLFADNNWTRNAIDVFVYARLQEQGLAPAAEADRRTLIRRIFFDLVGLPPSPEEVDRFAVDPDPEAYEKLVDRLLDSPRYGERWARHWLDVVHYGETHGYDKDKPRLNAWPYRDYVIRSFNQDKPYARFVQEQVAGDILFPGTVDGIEALGFIAAGPWDHVGHAEVPETKIDG